MSGYRLCQVPKARHPYYIESINTNIYTIEELCFYLRHNVCLIDETLVNEKLCDWIRDELGLKKLYNKLYEQLQKEEDSIAYFIFPIFKEIHYLTHVEYRSMQQELARIEVQPEDLRRKMKADYLVNYEMYGNALNEYYQILKERTPGKLGVQFYASILNNMAVAYGKMFLFEEAADCLWQSYTLVRANETYRRYLMILPFFLSKADYVKRLEELHIPKQQQDKIEKQAREYQKDAMDTPPGKLYQTTSVEDFVANLKKQYQKNNK